MKRFISLRQRLNKSGNELPNLGKGENGSAMIIALLVMILLMGFVALAISRTSNETVASANDASETKTFEAAQASLEVMTHNFNKIFDYQLTASTADLTRIQSQYPAGFTTDYNFNQVITKTQNAKAVVMTGQQYQGLHALRDEWEINSMATSRSDGVQVALRRKFFNNRIPIFQFGIFYEDPLEFHPGPRFDFGGRVHSNEHLYMKSGNGLYFSSKVTSAGEIFTDVMRNGTATGTYTDKVWIKNATGSYVSLNHDMGSVLNGVTNGAPVINEPDMPVAYANASWAGNELLFQGNLLAKQRRLDLPLRIASTTLDYIEVIKRGKAVGDLYNDGTGTVAAPNIVPVPAAAADTQITTKERYYNKRGIRISLADSKAKLPGCSSGIGVNPVNTPCGVRLDGASDGQGADADGDGSRGYQPRTMRDGYQATRLNGQRFYRGPNLQSWIKIETVAFDLATQAIVTLDITEDVLSLGVTQPAPRIPARFEITEGNYYGSNRDTRSVVKLQRFMIGGGKVETVSTNFITVSTLGIGGEYNFVVTDNNLGSVNNGTSGDFTGDHNVHKKDAAIDSILNAQIVPFPIKIFDPREGIYDDGMSLGTVYGANIPKAGVFSVIDLDIANLKRFLDGDFDANFPDGTPFQTATGNSLSAARIPEANGWVVYFSDRRGDFDFDGEYDMEDIYGNNDGILQFGEDVNENGTLQADYFNESVLYTGAGNDTAKGIAATIDHRIYRRALRLINGQRVPGVYDSGNPSNTKGFTVASENGVYTLGNYNATGIAAVGTPTASTQYLPQNTVAHIPASIAADAISILSNAWTDGNGFERAFDKGNRNASETTVRFAMMAGDSRSSLLETGEPNQGGGDLQLSGGVHNFKRFVEDWGGQRLNYAGSLINLYNSRNNNATFKCCSTVYSPPTRNWVFDATFLDPDRLPPGTPYFQTLQLTGFQRLD